MTFYKLATFLEKLEKTPSRNDMTVILATLFKEAEVTEIDKICYLSLGKLLPKFYGVEFQMADKLVIKAIAEAFYAEETLVKKLYQDEGDLGLVISNRYPVLQGRRHGSLLARMEKPLADKLTVTAVYEALMRIAKDAGEGSVERKVRALAELLRQLDDLSAKFVVRIPLGKLRLGFSEMTVLDSLSWFQFGDKSGKNLLESAYYVAPDVGLLARLVKEKGLKKAVANLKPTLGLPVLPMLAQRLKDPAEMIVKMGRVAVEPKLDGLRIALHFARGRLIQAFTRNLNETTWIFPELAEMPQFIKADSVILDCEAVGLDPKRELLVNFQTTMTRRRKHEITAIAGQVPIKFFVFDILYKNGESLMEKTYQERRQLLLQTVKESRLFSVVDAEETTSAIRIAEVNKKAREQGFEGIIIKQVHSHYVPGRTGWRWVKMKEGLGDAAKLADTLDCVVLGYTAGKGKRTEFGLGQFLVGILDGENIKTITKVGTGISDDQIKELKKRLDKLRLKLKPKEYLVPKELTPDFWVKPDLVVEIAGDEITKSPNHSSGYALRFPRLIKIREDKDYTQATTLREVRGFLTSPVLKSKANER